MPELQQGPGRRSIKCQAPKGGLNRGLPQWVLWFMSSESLISPWFTLLAGYVWFGKKSKDWKHGVKIPMKNHKPLRLVLRKTPLPKVGIMVSFKLCSPSKESLLYESQNVIQCHHTSTKQTKEPCSCKAQKNTRSKETTLSTTPTPLTQQRRNTLP